jgi:poly-gamma-glutamate synthesis protein (capsule biosynthesis protein)
MIDNEIKILITGDFCPINRIEELAITKNSRLVFNDVLDLLNGNDLNITDLECPLTLSDTARSKIGPHQKAHPDCIDLLKASGIGLVALANNHIMDYGTEGIVDTLRLCKDNDIATVGIGSSPEVARTPYSVTLKGKRVAILNFADNEFIAAPDGSYYCNPVNAVDCFYDLTGARQNHDFLIVIIHAGNEFFELPSPRTKQLYRYIIDLGADVVISHHTHAFSGYEIYKSKPIFFGLGNFLYDWPGNFNSNWNRGYMVKLKISDTVHFEIIPIKQCNEEPGVFRLNEEETDVFFEVTEKLNLIIADDLKLEAEFKKYCNNVFPRYDAFIEPYFGKFITALRKRGLFPKLLTRRKRLLLLNLTRCESHRDVLIRLLKQAER